MVNAGKLQVHRLMMRNLMVMLLEFNHSDSKASSQVRPYVLCKIHLLHAHGSQSGLPVAQGQLAHAGTRGTPHVIDLDLDLIPSRLPDVLQQYFRSRTYLLHR